MGENWRKRAREAGAVVQARGDRARAGLRVGMGVIGQMLDNF